jgi:hypothetical protein
VRSGGVVRRVKNGELLCRHQTPGRLAALCDFETRRSILCAERC